MSGSQNATIVGDLTSEINEERVKEEMSSIDDEFEEKLNPDIPPTQTPSIVDEIDIKYEEVDYHHRISTTETDSDCNSNLENIPRVRGSNDPEGKHLKDFYRNLLHCDPDCETCVEYLRMLREHVRTTHAPPQPIQDNDQSSSIEIKFKCEVDETTQKIECSQEASETNVPLSDISEPVPERKSEPDFIAPASAYLTRNARRQGLTKSKVSSDSKISKGKKGTLSSRKQLKCNVCQKSFTTKSHLNVHKRLHTVEKPYECSLCEKIFSHASSLSFHSKVHTGEELYACDLCEKRFRRSDRLSLHKSVIHNHTEEKPCKCSVCDKSFLRNYQLTSHMRTHTGEKPFKCDVCGKGFGKTYHLTEHKRTHTGERPFTCQECGQCFKFNRNLTVHKRIHTGESFSTPSQLNYDRKMKH